MLLTQYRIENLTELCQDIATKIVQVEYVGREDITLGSILKILINLPALQGKE
jgi:hypothetical protein